MSKRRRDRLTALEAKLLRLIAINAYKSYRNTLVGCKPQVLDDTYAVVTKPRPGDWVLETSTFHYEGACRGKRRRKGAAYRLSTGRLIGWAEHRYRGRVVYLENIHGRLVKWHNCSFIRVLNNLSFEQHFGAEAPSGPLVLDEHGYWSRSNVVCDAPDKGWVTKAIKRHKLGSVITEPLVGWVF